MTAPLRILQLRASRFLGGPERQILRYATFQPESGDPPIETVIGSFIGSGEGTEFLKQASTLNLSTLELPDNPVSALFSLTQYLRKEHFDLVCTHGYKADIVGSIAGRLTSIPVACFLRGWTGENTRVRIYELLDRALLRLSSRIVCLSNAQAKRIADLIGQTNKIRVVINAIDPRNTAVEDRMIAKKMLSERFNIPQAAPLIGSAGRLSPEKGTAIFIQAAKQVHASFPEARFIIFGDGSQRKHLEELTQGCNYINFAGHVSDLGSLLPGLDILVNPSLSEEMPNVVLEAMAMGIPTIATAVGGVKEIAGPDSAIALVPPSDPEVIARSIQDFLRTPIKAQRLGSAGQARVIEAFSPDRQREQLFNLYCELIPGFKVSREPSGKHPFISVVMPVRNEALHIVSVLRDLVAQDFPADRLEILVADGNSTDDTVQLVNEFAASSRVSVRVIPNPKQLSSAGRNAGVLDSRGDIIAFVDGHCQIPTLQLFSDIVDLMETQHAECLCRPQPLQVPGNSAFQQVVANTRATIIGHGTDSTIFDMDKERVVNPSSSGAIYSARVFERVGMYDENFDACEDVEFNFRVWKAGIRAFSSPRVAVFYSPRNSLGALWKQVTRYGQGRFRLMLKHSDAITLAQLIPAGFVAWLLVWISLSVTSGVAAQVVAFTILVYFLVTVSFAILLAFRYGWRHLVFSPLVYLVIHFGLGYGFWKEALFGWSRRTKQASMPNFERSPGKLHESQGNGLATQ